MARTPRGKIDPGKQTATGQIKPGNTLNPKGRPKGSVGRSAMMFKVLSEEIPVAIQGKKKKMPAGEAAFRKLLQEALGGDKGALAQIFREWAKLEEKLEREQQPTYEFTEADERTIEEIYNRMKAIEGSEAP